MPRRSKFFTPGFAVPRVLFCVTFAVAPALAADFQRSFGLASGDDLLWAYVRYPDPTDHQLGLHFAYARATESGTLRAWRHSGLVSIRGQIRFSAVSARSLHVFYSDGSHVRYDTPMPGVQSVRTTERKLPRNALPLALCADTDAGTLYALADRAIAQQIVAERDQFSESPQEDAPNGTDTTGALERELSELPEDADYFVLRYTGTRWVVDSPAPRIAHAVQRWWLVSTGKLRYLLYQANTPEGLTVFTLTQSDSGWLPPASWVLPDGQEVVDCIAVENSPAIITRSGAVIALHRNPGTDNTATVSLDSEGSNPTFFERDLAIAMWKGGLAISTVDDQDQLWVGYWSVATGKPLMTPGAVQPLTPRRRPVIDQQFQSLLSFVGLAVIMGTVFARRREAILNPLPTPEGTVPATHLKRLLAFVLDALLCSPLTLGGMWLWASSRSIDFRLVLTDYSAIEPFWIRSFSLWLVGCTVFVLYCTVFETLWSATPGKRIVGCKVVRESGEPGSFATFLVRNVIRYVEFFLPFQFLPVIVLVLLTRNRQRLGDLVAATLVVETLPRTAEPQQEVEIKPPEPPI